MKEKTEDNEILESINSAVDECIQKGILKDILIKNREEVIETCLWEYNMESLLRAEKEDSYEDGFQDGKKSERNNTLQEKERADAEKSRADTAENRADAAEQELARLREELRKLREKLPEE